VLLGAAETARTIPDAELMGRALLADYRGTFGVALHVDEPGSSALRAALELTAPGALGAARRPDLVAGRRAGLGARTGRSRGAGRRGPADRAAHSATTSWSCGCSGLRQWVVYQPLDRRIAEIEELMALVDLHGDPNRRFDAASHASFTYLCAGNASGHGPVHRAGELPGGSHRPAARRVDAGPAAQLPGHAGGALRRRGAADRASAELGQADGATRCRATADRPAVLAQLRGGSRGRPGARVPGHRRRVWSSLRHTPGRRSATDASNWASTTRRLMCTTALSIQASTPCRATRSGCGTCVRSPPSSPCTTRQRPGAHRDAPAPSPTSSPP
jgi:hypothetical protein